MIYGQRTTGRTIFIHCQILLALLAFAPSLAFGQSGSATIPANAIAKGYGSGWECDRGYREVDGSCAAVKVPENWYFVDSSHDPGCKCNRGYRATKKAFVAVNVPENAHLDYSGNDWECDPPFRQQEGLCTLPKVGSGT